MYHTMSQIHCLTKHQAKEMYWGVEAELHTFLTLALDEDEW